MYKDNILLDNSEIMLNTSNIKNEEEITNNISVTDIELNLSEARKINKGKGKYITIKFNKEKIDNELKYIVNQLQKNLSNVDKLEDKIYFEMSKTEIKNNFADILFELKAILANNDIDALINKYKKTS